MKMTFKEYIDNPAGKGNSVVANKSMYKEMYTSKFDKIMVRENGIVHYKVYKEGGNNDSYYIHIKIPSEVVSNFYYDVVIQLWTDTIKEKNSVNLNGYYAKFFSNDPSFTYTFAYAFNKNGMFVDILKPRMNSSAIKDAAKTKNPKSELMYVKSLYFAYLVMQKYNLFNRTKLDSTSSKFSKRSFPSSIMKADDKITLRQSEYEKQRKKKKVEQRKESTPRRVVTNATKSASKSKISKVSKVSNISKVSKKTKSVKKI